MALLKGRLRGLAFALAFALLAAGIIFVPSTDSTKASAFGGTVVLNEGFDAITTLPGAGWVQTNRSAPAGTTNWFQASATAPFPAQAGAATAYIGANFNNTAGGTGTISNWLITPTLTLNNGDQLKFWTRVPTGSTWDDRLEVRLSTNGSSSDVGTTATSVGDFTTVLGIINPDYNLEYPEVWTEFTYTVSGLSAATSGRIAFRYNVIEAGPTGTYSNYIGIDTVSYTAMGGPGPTPTPGGPTPTPTATPTPTPTPTPSSELEFCSSTVASITDNTPAGINQTVTIPTSGTITNLRLRVNATHSWVGDLRFTLSHGATSAVVIDRPGVPTSTFGCSGNNINNNIVDDDAATAFETGCTNDPNPAYPTGTALRGGDPAGPVMAAFDGADYTGTWTLNISDNAAGDTGTINSWCLLVTTSAGPTPTPTPTPTATPTPAPGGDARADFDGDGRTDVSVFRGSTGIWYMNRSTAGFGALNWGVASDTLTPADFDGDGKADVAVFRPAVNPATPDFYVLNSATFTVGGASWGVPGDTAAVADYDGDNKADYAIYRASTQTWFILRSSDGGNTISGGAAGTPVPADYDGDGKADIVNYSNGTWAGMGSLGTPINVSLGAAGDIAVPGDFDGDGEVDHAVFRPTTGQWFYRSSDTGNTVTTVFGVSGDVPVPGDYDGDGKEDLAVFRAGVWWINRSTAGVIAVSFGVASDAPVVAAARP